MGTPPDPRFSLANERTFLAWTRTALAMVAGGIAAHAPVIDLPRPAAMVISFVLFAMAAIVALGGWWRWRRSEVAMRTSEPLPAFVGSLAIAFGTFTVVVAAGVAVVAGEL